MSNKDIYQDIDWNIGKQVTDFLPSPAELMCAKTVVISSKKQISQHNDAVLSENKK